MSLARIILRPHRVEAVGVAVMVVVAFLVSVGLVLRLQAFGIPDECFGNSMGGFGNSAGELCPPLQPAISEYGETVGKWGFFANAAMVLLPAIGGILFGLALVGKELDQGTTTFAWSVGPSRRRWLLQRVLLVGIPLTLIGLAAGAIADQSVHMQDRFTDHNGTLNLLGIRGFALAAETVAYFGLALLVGAVLGRVLPSLLMSVVLVFGVFAGTTAVTDAFLTHETVLAYYSLDGVIKGRIVDSLIQTPEGELLDWSTAYSRYGDEGMMLVDAPDSGFRTVLKINPPELYPIAVARMFIVFSTVGLLAIALTFVVVERRRPT